VSGTFSGSGYYVSGPQRSQTRVRRTASGVFLEDAEQGLGRSSRSPPALLPVLDGVPPENVLLVRAASPVFNRRNRRNLWQNPSSLPSREGRSDRGMEDSKEKTFSAADYADFADWGKGGNTDEPGPAFGRNQEKPRAFIALRGTSGELGMLCRG